MTKLNSIWSHVALTLLSFQLTAMTTQNDRILNGSGQEVQFKGINWYGFNNGQTMVEGLWNNSNPVTFDFATVVYRMQLLGFNAIRLPFSFKDFYQLSPRNFESGGQVASQLAIQASVTNPSIPVPPGTSIPPMNSPPNRISGELNDYIPNDTTLNRFLWVVNFFAKNGFYVLIDNHTEDPTLLENQTVWFSQWKDLVTKISQDPISKEMLMIDLLNEPDSRGIRWEASGGKPALKDLYISTIDALYPINPRALYFIEGTGQGGIGANWGDGFATDLSLINQFGLSNPNPFFQTLLSKPYVNQIVISPHVYPPSVTHASNNYSGPGLWNRLSKSFGYLNQTGYSFNGVTKIFPIAIGEFGSEFQDATDIQSMTDIASYLNDTGGAADGQHRTIPNWFYWTWNPTSGDTGGLVQDNWLDVQWQKLNYLTTMGLKPWYSSTTPVQLGTLTLSVAPTPGLSKANLRPINVGDQVFQFTDFNTPISKSLPVGAYTIAPPPIQVATTLFTADSKNVTITKGAVSSVQIVYKAGIPSQSQVDVSVQVGTPWQDNPSSGTYKNTVNVFVKNMGSNPISAPWKISLINSNYADVASSWNVHIDSIQSGQINGTASDSWETLSPLGGNVINLGMIISSKSQNFMPTSVLINGQAATITAN